MFGACASYDVVHPTVIVYNGNRTEWSTIQGVIGRVISKSAERAPREADLKLRARLLSELYDTKSYYQLIVTITKLEKNITVV